MARTIDPMAASSSASVRLVPARLRRLRLRVRDARDRGRALAEALPLIERRLEAQPGAAALPILIAGTGERITLRLVAQHADSWHAAFPDQPAELESKVAVLDRWCADRP